MAAAMAAAMAEQSKLVGQASFFSLQKQIKVNEKMNA
jgi:hypothetical protein